MSGSIKRLFGLSAHRRSLLQGSAAVAGMAALARFAPAAPVAAQEPAPGGTLVLALEADPEILHPHRSTALLASRVVQLMHDALVSKGFDGTIQPGLAESWEISEDGLTYSFTLKTGVTFHSGKEFSSADVKYTFESWLADEASPSAYNFSAISTIETPGPTTVIFTLSRPNNLLLDQFSIGWAAILNQESVEAAGDQYGVSVVDGTGPFKFVSWQRNQSLVLERHEAYTWGAPIFANQGPAWLDGIEIRIIPEAATRIAEFQAGNVHLVANVPSADVERLTNADSVSILKYDQLQTIYFGMNQAVAPTNDLAVRQAINAAINKDEIVFGAYFGLGTPAISMVHPATPGYWEGVTAIAPTFDPDRANAILDEAGWVNTGGDVREKDGVKLELPFWVLNTPEATLTAQILEQQLAAVGIQLATEQFEESAWFEATRSGDQTAFTARVFYDTADVLYFCFHSAQMPAPNRFNYSVPEVDARLDDSRSNPDPAVVQAAYQSVQQRVIEDAVTAPLLHQLGVIGVADSVQGVEVHPSNWLYRALDISLAE